jgi:hypothetical protein
MPIQAIPNGEDIGSCEHAAHLGRPKPSEIQKTAIEAGWR